MSEVAEKLLPETIDPADVDIAYVEVLKELDARRTDLDPTKDVKKAGKRIGSEVAPKVIERLGLVGTVSKEAMGKYLSVVMSRRAYYRPTVEFLGGNHLGVGWDEWVCSLPPGM